MKNIYFTIIKTLCIASIMLVLSVGVHGAIDARCSMGDPDSVANAANAAWDAAIANGASCADAKAAFSAARRAALEQLDMIETPTAPAATTPATTTPAKTKTETKTETKAETKVETKAEPEPEPAHVHDYRKEITKMPSCTEPGIATYTCDCGDSYTEEIPAKGHDEGEWSTVVEPTCTTEGKKVLKCTTCGEVLKEETIPALGHTPGDWEITKQADWIHDGEQVKKCTVCGDILETQTIPANHIPLYIIGGAILLVIVVIAIVVKKKH